MSENRRYSNVLYVYRCVDGAAALGNIIVLLSFAILIRAVLECPRCAPHNIRSSETWVQVNILELMCGLRHMGPVIGNFQSPNRLCFEPAATYSRRLHE